MSLCVDMQCFVDWLYTWQTLISGLLALGAAYLAARKVGEQIRVMREQIAMEKRHRDDGIASKQRVARVAILHALSEMCSYTEQCMDALSSVPTPTSPPPEPTKSVTALMSGVEYLPEAPAETLVQLLQHYQVHRARLGQTPATAGDPLELVFDCIWLRHLTDRLFEYCRGEKSDVHPAPDQATFAELKTAYTMCNGGLSGALTRQLAVMQMCKRRASDGDQVTRDQLF